MDQRRRVKVSERIETGVGITLKISFTLLSIDRDIADKAAELRRLHGWKLPDAFQAALAIHHNVKLVTRNTKDFDPRRHSFVEVPYTL